MGGYDLVHYDDLAYVASAHQECKYLLVKITSLKLFKSFNPCSTKNGGFRHDCLSLSEERW